MKRMKHSLSLLLFFLLNMSFGCGPQEECYDFRISLGLEDPNGTFCNKVCLCNNLRFTGECNGVCQSKPREKCVVPGTTRSCLSKEVRGICQQGEQICQPAPWKEPYWGPCLPGQSDGKEVCDGKDNDCNGKVDDGLDTCCQPKSTRKCATNPFSQQEQGECKQGTQTCTDKRRWSKCAKETVPTPEVCDGKDNDCNGKIDDIAKLLCYTSPTGCTKNKGGYSCHPPCVPGKASCSKEGTFLCEGQQGPTQETCNNIDDDCDGQIDNIKTTPCYMGTPNTKGIGLCKEGLRTCVKGNWLCVGEVTPKEELCDKQDNNCNGSVDEALHRPCQNLCGLGTEQCNHGAWQNCTAAQPKPEVCDNKDNNCDGTIDEALSRPCKSKCGPGTERCRRGQWVNCDARLPLTEICDKKDNDCDGLLDEGCP